MKFTSVLALAVAATVVSAETNADRLARGLPPLAPARRGTPVARKRTSLFSSKRSNSPEGAKRTAPSSGSGQCNTGSTQCCDSVSKSGHGGPLDDLLGLLAIEVPHDTPCGVSCSPMGGKGSNW